MDAQWTNEVKPTQLLDLQLHVTKAKETIQALKTLMSYKKQLEDYVVEDVTSAGDGLQQTLEQAAGTGDLLEPIDREFNGLQALLSTMTVHFLAQMREQERTEPGNDGDYRARLGLLPIAVSREELDSLSKTIEHAWNATRSIRSLVEQKKEKENEFVLGLDPEDMTREDIDDIEEAAETESIRNTINGEFESLEGYLDSIKTKFISEVWQRTTKPSGSTHTANMSNMSKRPRTTMCAPKRPSVVDDVFRKLRLDKEGKRA